MQDLSTLPQKRRWENDQLRLFRTLLEVSSDAVFVIDPASSRFLEFNEVAHRQLGYSREELLARRVTDISANDPTMEAWQNHIQQLRQVPFTVFEGQQIRKDGTLLSLEVNVRLVRYEERDYVISLARDISERLLARKKLTEEKNKLEAVLAALGDGLTMQDRDFRILYQNKVHKNMQGECVGRTCYEAYQNREDICPGCLLFKCFEDGQVHRRETSSITPEGKTLYVEVSSSPVRDAAGNIYAGVETLRDITSRKFLEQELQKRDKLESIGVLAGGIAHDFNNMLTAIMGNISLAKLQLVPGHETYDILTESERACIRAQNLTQQLLTFSRGGAPVTRVVSIAELLEESAAFLLRGSQVRCQTSLPSDLWPAVIDAGQITQVIQNIIKNAEQAMAGCGVIHLTAENMELASDPMPALPGKRYIKISIHDDGPGVPPDYIDKIFDPYFTTKDHGIGLGLAISFSIVKNHHGTITVTSDAGKGTTFSVYLPASDSKVVASGKRDEEEPWPSVTSGAGTGQRILVMDDDQMVQNICSKLLKNLGYEVVAALDGTQTLNQYRTAREEGKPFAAVILDLTIPGSMGGKEVIRKLLQVDPEVRAIVSSGYADDPIMAKFREFGFVAVLPKPFRLEELRIALSQATA